MAWDRDKEKKAAASMSIGSCVFGIVFLIVWCAAAPSFMKLFGLAGLAMMIHRLYVIVQLSRDEKKKQQKELDPWDRPGISETTRKDAVSGEKDGFCPYCGRQIEGDFEFCPKCGRRLR